MRKLNDDYLPEQPLQPEYTPSTSRWKPVAEVISDHFSNRDTGKRLDKLIAYFSQLNGYEMDAEMVVQFCIDQIYKDTHVANPMTGSVRTFTRI